MARAERGTAQLFPLFLSIYHGLCGLDNAQQMSSDAEFSRADRRASCEGAGGPNSSSVSRKKRVTRLSALLWARSRAVDPHAPPGSRRVGVFRMRLPPQAVVGFDRAP